MQDRSYYAEKLSNPEYKDKIKVITGMYRCGKSTVLKQLQRDLRKRGIPLSRILYISFEASKHSDIRDGGALLFVMKNLIQGHYRMYLLLDEVENLPGWERAVQVIREKYLCDIYLAGTRSALFAEDGLPKDSYVEIPVYPYRFKEFIQARQEKQWDQDEKQAEEKMLQDYMIYGNMPGIHRMEQEQDTVFSYLLDVCQAGILQNVVRRWNLRNVDQIWMVLGCAAEQLGKPLSAKVIAQILKEEGRKVGKDTVYTLLRALTEAQILQKVPRFDPKMGRILEGQEKYYFTDWGMYHSLHGLHSGSTKALMENMVCMDLLASGWEVYCIQNQDVKVDFYACREKEKRYIQICEKSDAQEKECLLGWMNRVSEEGEKRIILREAPENEEEIALLDYLKQQ